MYNAWSIFIRISVPEMSRTWKVRIFFLIAASVPNPKVLRFCLAELGSCLF